MNLENLTNEEIAALRKSTVKTIAKLDNLQHAMKIFLNSVYGALG